MVGGEPCDVTAEIRQKNILSKFIKWRARVTRKPIFDDVIFPFHFLFSTSQRADVFEAVREFPRCKKTITEPTCSEELIRTIDGKPGRIHSGNGFPALLGNSFERLVETT